MAECLEIIRERERKQQQCKYDTIDEVDDDDEKETDDEVNDWIQKDYFDVVSFDDCGDNMDDFDMTMMMNLGQRNHSMMMMMKKKTLAWIKRWKKVKVKLIDDLYQDW